jgi:hypothetical protein
MKIGDYVETPRFLRVKISAIFLNMEEAHTLGYTEPTHYEGEYIILGKVTGENRMRFAAIQK